MQKKPFETILYSSAGIIVMLALVIAVNVLTGVKPLRADLTQEKIYTLSDGTKTILKKLDTPVKIRFYCTQSDTATPETVYLKSYAREVEDLLQEYKQIAGKNLIIEKYDPQPDSDAADSPSWTAWSRSNCKRAMSFTSASPLRWPTRPLPCPFSIPTANASSNTTSRVQFPASSRPKNRWSAS